MKIPFNKPYITSNEFDYIQLAHKNAHLAGDGPFTSKCHQWIEQKANTKKALLTHSCTAALEMSALLLDIKLGDEVIMPSYTFVSTANAFVLRGGIPVFVDIRQDTLNLDESLIEAAITNKTKAIVVVHYAGVACEMDTIMNIAKQYNLAVIEDAAQGVMASYKGHALGSIGHLGTYSFHETKNVISGEGGALLINQQNFIEQAEIIREKGTNRNQFFRGEVDKYTWQSLGSSFLPGELIAAFLWAQLEQAKEITQKRLALWNYYHQQLESSEADGKLRRPVISKDCQHNAHMYYVLIPNEINRNDMLSKLSENGVNAIFHYIPLHSSPAGKKFGRISGDLLTTNNSASRIIRLPLWIGLTQKMQNKVITEILSAISSLSKD